MMDRCTGKMADQEVATRYSKHDDNVTRKEDG